TANIIANNGGYGIAVKGASATGNTLRQNSAHSNSLGSIQLSNGGNAGISPPTITSGVGGTACASCIIDVYSDAGSDATRYQSFTTADGAGNWSFTGGVAGPNVTATATDSSGNTSELSSPGFAITLGDLAGQGTPCGANPIGDGCAAHLSIVAHPHAVWESPITHDIYFADTDDNAVRYIPRGDPLAILPSVSA